MAVDLRRYALAQFADLVVAKLAELAIGPSPPPRGGGPPQGGVVVWLDELHRYLDGEHGLTGGVMRALLGAPRPLVIIGTLWPDRYAAWTAVPAPGGPDPRAGTRGAGPGRGHPYPYGRGVQPG